MVIPNAENAGITEFQHVVWRYYAEHGRHMPWRDPASDGVFDPYAIMVSEVMLQQTQVNRVIPKYQQFLQAFPTVHNLAAAELGDVLRLWNGLGYNRRAQYLWRAAQYAVAKWGGKLLPDVSELINMPGIGRNTAGAVRAYAFNLLAVFVETNICTVFIHHFFPGRADVADAEILPLLEMSLPGASVPVPGHGVREWYWALMDYGTYLKSANGNISRASKHYSKQSTFQGSTRQLRGQVLRALADAPRTVEQLRNQLPDERLPEVLQALTTEGMIRYHGDEYSL